ncbi:proteinase inhibitor I4 serpin-like protein, partial [Leptotrombidium deliense]
MLFIFCSVVIVAAEFNSDDELGKIGKVTFDFAIKMNRNLVKTESNPVCDVLNMMLGSSALLPGCSEHDRKILFNSIHFQTAYNKPDEAVNALMKLNFHQMQTSKTIFVVSSSYNVTLPFYRFLVEYPYAYLKLSVDLENNTIAEIDELMEDISNGTADREITNIFRNSLQLGKSEKLIMLHANHFERKFKQAFDKKKTAPGTFQNLDGKNTSVSFMNRKGNFRYYSDDKISALEIPFDNGD